MQESRPCPLCVPSLAPKLVGAANVHVLSAWPHLSSSPHFSHHRVKPPIPATPKVTDRYLPAWIKRVVCTVDHLSPGSDPAALQPDHYVPNGEGCDYRIVISISISPPQLTGNERRTQMKAGMANALVVHITLGQHPRSTSPATQTHPRRAALWFKTPIVVVSAHFRLINEGLTNSQRHYDGQADPTEKRSCTASFSSSAFMARGIGCVHTPET